MTENESKIYEELKKFCKYQRFRKFCYAKYIEDTARSWIVVCNKYHKGYTQEEFYSEVALVFEKAPCSYDYSFCRYEECMELNSIPVCKAIVEEWMNAYEIGGKKGNEETWRIMSHYFYREGWVDYVPDDDVIKYSLSHYKYELETYLNFNGPKPDLQSVVKVLKQSIREGKEFIVHIDNFACMEEKNKYSGQIIKEESIKDGIRITLKDGRVIDLIDEIDEVVAWDRNTNDC